MQTCCITSQSRSSCISFLVSSFPSLVLLSGSSPCPVSHMPATSPRPLYEFLPLCYFNHLLSHSTVAFPLVSSSLFFALSRDAQMLRDLGWYEETIVRNTRNSSAQSVLETDFLRDSNCSRGRGEGNRYYAHENHLMWFIRGPKQA